MAINRAKKEEIVTDLKDRLSRSRIAILTDYKGLSVAEVNKLRDELRKVDVEFRVAKNSLMKLAVKGSKMEGLGPLLQGPRAVAMSYEDPDRARQSAHGIRQRQRQAGDHSGRIGGQGHIAGRYQRPCQTAVPRRAYRQVAGDHARSAFRICKSSRGDSTKIALRVNGYSRPKRRISFCQGRKTSNGSQY